MIVMDKNFKFSIVTAFYNTELYIADCIESVINQTLDFKDNIQLIVKNLVSVEKIKDVNKKLYLKLKGKWQLEEIRDVVSMYPGSTGVVFYFEDTKEAVMTGADRGVQINDTLMDELSKKLGVNSVVLK